MMNKIKDNIIKCFVNYPDYYAILHRMAYYDQISSGISVSIPYEPCSDKFFRLIMTNKPSPYFTEYREVSEELDVENLAAQIAVDIRTLFGYSCRLSKVKKPSLSSNNLSHQNLKSARSEMRSPIPLNDSLQNGSRRGAVDSVSRESHASFNHFLHSSSNYYTVNQKISRTANFIPMLSSKNYTNNKILPS